MAGPLWYDRVKFTTATTGTGTITVGSASSGYQTPAGASIATGTIVNYTIEDGTAWEVGYGVYTVSGTTLTRVLISSSTGSLLNLSGSAVCFISATSEYLLGAARNGRVKANLAAGRYYGPDGFIATTTGTTTADRLYCWCYSGMLLADAMAMEVTANATGSTNCRMGIYDSTASGKPGLLIEEVSAVSMAATGVQVSTFTATRLIAKPIWIVGLTNSATPTVRKWQAYSGVGREAYGLPSLSASHVRSLYAAYSYAALPADLTSQSWTEETSDTPSNPFVFLRSA